jgi:hypothetical protein
MFIYMSSGEVLQLPTATSIAVAGSTVLVMSGKDILASLPLAKVWFSSKDRNAPVPS